MPAAWAGDECAFLANCTSVPNTPWVSVPAAKKVSGSVIPATAARQIVCPGAFPVAAAGFAANVKERDGDGFSVDVRLPPAAGGTSRGSFAIFVGTNENTTANAFQPLLGCIPRAPEAKAQKTVTEFPDGTSHHVKTIDVKPSRTRTHRHRCPEGKRLLDAGHSVAFYQERPPSARELRHHDIDLDQGRRGARAKITTRSTVGDDEPVDLQIHLFCQ